MTTFVRYPHTPHLARPSGAAPRGDKVLSSQNVNHLLAGEVTVEEKVDGANLGLSRAENGDLAVQNRGTFLTRSAAAEQFRPLWGWLAPRRDRLLEALGEQRILFGEWCYARHSVPYTRLPDWFLVFDVYDREGSGFWSADRRDTLASSLDLVCVPRIARGHFQLQTLATLIGGSRIGDAGMEGIVVRRDDGDWQVGRAKLVRAEFVQAIDSHWSHRRLEPNRLAVPSQIRVERDDPRKFPRNRRTVERMVSWPVDFCDRSDTCEKCTFLNVKCAETSTGWLPNPSGIPRRAAR